MIPMYKVIAKQCKNCNLIVLLDNFNKYKSGKFGRKATCKHCDKINRELSNKDPFNDKAWNIKNLPGANNSFLHPDLAGKYELLCQSKTYQLYIKFPEIPIDIISTILVEGFMLGNFAVSEALSEEMLKEQYL